jgi:hypothetical protein
VTSAREGYRVTPTITLSVAELSSIELKGSKAGGGWSALMVGEDKEQCGAVASIIVFGRFI